MSFACGLDLGTTFSCIGVYRNGGVEIIPNTNSDRTTPSIVTILDNNKLLIGEEALDHLVKNYDSTIFDVKRFIGKDFNEKKVQKGIKLEKYPFKMVANKNKFHEIEINKNNETKRFTIEQITSFIIKKMVQSAEKYLNKKVSNLVITVPANFNDAQRICTRQAAEIAGIKVLRIINEPTAAALAYGLQEKVEELNGKILIFDLGGGTFDVTILSITKEENSKIFFNILSTNGNKFLGGVDFDDKLVEYILKQFCDKNKLTIEEVKKDKKAIRKLKITCEKIKRDLSFYQKVTLSIDNFYNNKNILEEISRYQFNQMCEDLIEKLEKPLERAIKDAKITRKDISQIILVGGSTKLPMVKSFLKNYFKNSKINDSINPDEAVAYGATLMAAKILLNDDNILSDFDLFDITPLSLGIEVENKSKDKEIQKEGGIMSVIINRGTALPTHKERNYSTIANKQKTAIITIYEGEKKYVKYNHILGKIVLSGLPGKGKIMIKIKFFIDVNGILTVTATRTDENGKEIIVEAVIKNDMVNLTKEQIDQLKEINKKYLHSSINTSDSTSVKDSLKDCEDGYNECEDEKERFNILMSSNNILEDFIDSFDKDFDNETMIEKYYIYINEIFTSYTKTLNCQTLVENNQENEEIKQNFINKTMKYVNFFINKSFAYLDNLLKTIQDYPKNIFYKIIVDIMEQLNNRGKQCIKDINNYSRYNALIYFEKSQFYYDTYISKLINLTDCGENIYNKCNIQIRTSQLYIKEINSGIIFLSQDAIKHIKLIPNVNKNTLNFFNNNENEIDNIIENEKNKLILENYEKMFESLKGNGNLEEAICIANIIKIKLEYLGCYDNLVSDLELGKRCETTAKKCNTNPTTPWYEEFQKLNENLKNFYENSS